jgi:hypothetical protein
LITPNSSMGRIPWTAETFYPSVQSKGVVAIYPGSA